jgi:hypothetical protein
MNLYIRTTCDIYIVVFDGLLLVIFILDTTVWKILDENNFADPEEPYLWKRLQARKQRKRLVAHGNYSCTANCRAVTPAIFRGTLGILRKISKIYLFIPRFLWEPLTMFRETLIWERCPKNLLQKKCRL